MAEDLYSFEQFAKDLEAIRGGAPSIEVPGPTVPISVREEPETKPSPLATLMTEGIGKPSVPLPEGEPATGPVKQAFKDIWIGFKQGVYGEADALDMVANVGAKITGLPKGQFFRSMMSRVFEEPTEEEIKPGLGHMVLRGMGAAIPIIAEFIVGTKGVGAAMQAAKLPTAIKLGGTAATQGARWLGPKAAQLAAAQKARGVVGLAAPTYFGGREAGLETARGIVEEEPITKMVPKAAIRGAGGVALGTGLELLHPLKAVAAVPAGAGMFGTQAAIEQMAAGEPPLSQETISSLLVGGALVGGPRLLKAAGQRGAPKTEESKIEYITVKDRNNQDIQISKSHLNVLRRHLVSKGFDPVDLQTKSYSELQTILEDSIYPKYPYRPSVAEKEIPPIRSMEEFMKYLPPRGERPLFEEFMKQIPKPTPKPIAKAEKERATSAQEKTEEVAKQAASDLMGREYWQNKFQEGEAYLVNLVSRGKGGGFKDADGRYVASTEQFEMACTKIGIAREDRPKRFEFFSYLAEKAQGEKGKKKGLKKFGFMRAPEKEEPIITNVTHPELKKNAEELPIRIRETKEGELEIEHKEKALTQSEVADLLRKIEREDSYLEPTDFASPEEARAYLAGTISEADITERIETEKRGEMPPVIAPMGGPFRKGDVVTLASGMKGIVQWSDAEETSVAIKEPGRETGYSVVPNEQLIELNPRVEVRIEAKAPKAEAPERLVKDVEEQARRFAKEREAEMMKGAKIPKERIVSKEKPTFPTEEATEMGVRLTEPQIKALLKEHKTNLDKIRKASERKKTVGKEERTALAGKMRDLAMRNNQITDELHAYFGEPLSIEEMKARLTTVKKKVQTYQGKVDIGRPSVLKEYKPVLDETDIPTRVEDIKWARRLTAKKLGELPTNSREAQGLRDIYEDLGRELSTLERKEIPEMQSPYPDLLRRYEGEVLDILKYQRTEAEAARKAKIETTIPEKGKRAVIRAEVEEELEAPKITQRDIERLRTQGVPEDVIDAMLKDTDIKIDREVKSPKDVDEYIKPTPKTEPPKLDANEIAKLALAKFQTHMGDMRELGIELNLAKDRYINLVKQQEAASESLRRDPNNPKIKASLEELNKQLDVMAPEIQGLTRLAMDMEKTTIGGAPEEGYRTETMFSIFDASGKQHQGAIVSHGYEGGSTYFVLQGPGERMPDATRPENIIAGTAYLVDAKKEGRPALKLETWDAKGLVPEVQDALLDCILTKNLEGAKPKEVVYKKGVADDVWDRRKDRGFEADYNAKVRRAIELGAIKEQMAQGESLAESLRSAMDLKAKAETIEEHARADTIIDGIRQLMDKEAEEGKKTGKEWTSKERIQYCKAALELNDAIDQSLTNIDYADVTQKPTRNDMVPWLDKGADPSKSSNPTMRRLANYGMQFELAYRHSMRHYMKLLDTRLGWIRNNPEKSREFMKHLHDIEKSTDPAILQAEIDHRMIMDDLAHRFELEKKGLYVKKYATLVWDMEKIWQHFGGKLRTTSDYVNLPNKIRASFEPEHWGELKRIAEQYKDKPWTKIHPDDRTYFMKNYLQWAGVFPEWNFLPQDLQNIIPEKKWVAYFQKRTPAGNFLKEIALSEDYWDVTSKYLAIAIRGAMTNEFLSRANPLLRTLPFKGTKGTWGDMASKYVRNLAGFGTDGLLDAKWNAIAKEFNRQLSQKNIDINIPMFLPSEFASWYRESLYRGALGPDTALRNLTQSIYTWADQGTMPLLKGIVNATRAWAAKSPEWTKFRESMDLIEENYWNEMANLRKASPGLYGKIKHVNQRITHLALTPLRITENINKAIAYFAALEKGIKDGVDFRTQHLVGLRAASNIVPDFELSEGQWRAWQGMGAGQFLYGKANISPYMTGTGMSILTPFWSFPVKSAQFLRNGIKESWISGDRARLTRFFLLSAFMIGAPTFLATLGIDAFAVWGKGALPIDLMPMWYNTMRDLYVGAGGSDSDDFMSKELARRRLREAFWMMTLPQYRWAKKTGIPYELGLTDIKGSYQRLDDKYVRWGRTESPMANTNWFKETLTTFGWPPMDRREGRKWMREAKDISQAQTYQKSKIMRKLLDMRADGNTKAFLNAWKMAKAQGIEITSDDISMAQSKRDMDAFTIQAKTMPKKIRGQWMKSAEEMKRKYLRKGKRSMWVSPPSEEEEE